MCALDPEMPLEQYLADRDLWLRTVREEAA